MSRSLGPAHTSGGPSGPAHTSGGPSGPAYAPHGLRRFDSVGGVSPLGGHHT